VTPTPLRAALDRLRRLAGPPTAEADAALLDRFARLGDAGAFAALVGRHGPLVLAACRRAAGDAHLAEDAFQATAYPTPGALSGGCPGPSRPAGGRGRPGSIGLALIFSSTEGAQPQSGAATARQARP
jgi:hypothetical protein